MSNTDENLLDKNDNGLLELSLKFDDPLLFNNIMDSLKEKEGTDNDNIEITEDSKKEEIPFSNYADNYFLPIRTQILRYTKIPIFFAEAAKGNITLNETKLLLYLFAELGSDYNCKDRYYRFKVTEFAEKLGYGDNIQSMYMAFRRMKSNIHEFRYSENDNEYIEIFEGIYVVDKDLYVVLKEDFFNLFRISIREGERIEKEHLENLDSELERKDRFTFIYVPLKAVLKLEHVQDIWIYILCLRFINTNIRYIDVGADFIQKKFGIGKLKYKPYNVFTNRIIDACYRISKVTKLTVIPKFNLNMKSKSGVQKDKTVIFIISKEKLSKDMENKFVNKGKELADKRNSIFYDWKM